MENFKLIGRNIAIQAETKTEGGIIISLNGDKTGIEVPERIKVSYVGHQVDIVKPGEYVTIKPYSQPTGSFKLNGERYLTFDSMVVIAVYSEEQALKENEVEKQQSLAKAEEDRIRQEAERQQRLGIIN